jgi:hypothetical protein
MRFSHLFETTGGLTLVALALIAPPAALAQTVISNETLVSTTFVVNKQDATAKCGKPGCSKKTPMFATIPVTCPAGAGQTCTFHISLDTKISIGFPCGQGCAESGPTAFYVFLVDDLAPTIGPTSKNGTYVFEKNVIIINTEQVSENYPASVLGAATNTSANSSHTIAVSIGCTANSNEVGCEATAHWSTMRVDVFEP